MRTGNYHIIINYVNKTFLWKYQFPTPEIAIGIVAGAHSIYIQLFHAFDIHLHETKVGRLAPVLVVLMPVPPGPHTNTSRVASGSSLVVARKNVCVCARVYVCVHASVQGGMQAYVRTRGQACAKGGVHVYAYTQGRIACLLTPRTSTATSFIRNCPPSTRADRIPTRATSQSTHLPPLFTARTSVYNHGCSVCVCV